MKKFNFRLQKVLEYRQLIKNEKLRMLMEAYYELHTLENHLEHLENLQAANAVTDTSVVDIERFVLVEAFGRRLIEEIGGARVKMIEVEKAVDAAMADYIAASKDEKAISLLKEKRRAEYVEMVFKEEAQFLDEVSVQRFGIRKSNASDGE